MAAIEYLQNQNWRILFHDVKIFGIQIDILARDTSGVLHLLEVKSEAAGDLGGVGFRQLARLCRVAGFLSEFEPCVLQIVLVEPGRFEFLPVDGLTD
ncbi:MAG: YraN family protein [Bdellovibrionales bacterium]